MTSKNLKGKLIKGVCVGRFHTVLYTSDAVYTCGLNAGQLGKVYTQHEQQQLGNVYIHTQQITCSQLSYMYT